MREDKFYKIGAGVLISVVVLIIALMTFGKKSNNKVAEAEQHDETSVSSRNVIENTNAVDKLEGLEEIKDTADEKSNKVDASTSKQTTEYMNKVQENTDTQSTSNNNVSESDEEDESTAEEDEELVFKFPVEGDTVREYAKDKLVYSNTLGEWITHPGIDIKADKTTIVKSAAPGVVKSIKNDPRYGLTVVVEHAKGYCTVYSNLLTAEFVSVGEKLSSDQTIGTVGNTASFEILDEPHLHFEILKDGEQIDPNMYLKK